MQKTFTASTLKSVQRGCISEIKKAIKQNAPIVFVEYKSYGKTVEKLTQLVSKTNYTNVYTITKMSNNGAREIDKLLREKRLPKNHLRVCGVNTDCCVLETVDGLDGMYGKRDLLIEVVSNACGSVFSHEDGVAELSVLSKKVVCV
jgi:nicotinamidase-related amidase